MYGKQKRDGEIAVLKEKDQGAKVTVLRVPLLYVPFLHLVRGRQAC
jgi:S-adenosylmethionine synthetase